MKTFKILAYSIILCINTAKAVYDLGENEKCASHVSGQQGTCLEPQNCEVFKTERNNLKICSFKHKVPIVCCPPAPINVKIKGTERKRISEIKCNQYIEASLKTRTARSPQIDQGIYGFIGGVKADFNEFPHIAAIGWRRKNDKIDWLCGGSLISEKFVLSAAHCSSLGGQQPEVIRVGDQDLLENEAEISPQDFAIKRITIHPQYKNSLNYHDIALFELNTPAIFTKDVFPACLSNSVIDLEEPVEAMGYGHTSFAGEPSNKLLKGFLSLVNNTYCNSVYGNDSPELPNGITNEQVCAFDPEGKRDTCQGDSGGPLQVTRQNPNSFRKHYVLIGITSFGQFCAVVPGVYVRVNSYLDWIESIVWRN